ncbi:hypothetical protein EYZ11_005264 [Aspergillus tanneri]|uniref:Uncharacterized protein n=1 Tax=Aspergillus tanneri TaxID=1220188 RepID=A0A4S3JKS3_9EURO|nr:hypothetical protein EYZ11_005264 [Aspergillus tanneri]
MNNPFDTQRAISPPYLQAMFAVRVSDTLNPDELAELCSWLRGLRKFAG